MGILIFNCLKWNEEVAVLGILKNNFKAEVFMRVFQEILSKLLWGPDLL